MDLKLSSCITDNALLCVFYATRHQIYWRFDTDDMVFAGTLIWYYTRRQAHTVHAGTNRMTQIYKYILTPPLTCIQHLSVLHWINNLLIQKFYLQIFTRFLLFKTDSLVELIYLLIRLGKTMSVLWNTKRMLMEMV